MIRIAHVTDAYLPRLGGIETHVDGLARQQIAAGDDVHVLTVTAGPSAYDEAGPVVRRGSHASLARVLRSGGFDMVHVHASVVSPLAMSLTVVACAHDLPVAVTVHSMWPDSAALVRPAGAGLRLGRRPVAWSTVSRSAARPLQRALGPSVPVSIVPNAVDVDWWRDGPARHSGDEVVVTSLLRMASRKRPVPLLRAMRRARALLGPEPRVRLVLAGDGPQLPLVRRLVALHGMESWVDLPGRLTREQARDLLHRSDVYVAPADLESFGIAALEARSVGLPVVAKRRGGVGEFVTSGREGLLVADDREMAGALAQLMSDRRFRESVRTHNSTVAPATTWAAALQTNGQLYARAARLAGRELPTVAEVAAS